MNIKKAVADEIIKTLEARINDINFAIYKNKNTIKAVALQQDLLKRQRKPLGELISQLKKQEPRK